MVTLGEIGNVLEGASLRAEKFYNDAVGFQKKWYLILTAVLVLLIITFVVASYTGHPQIIAVINALLVLILGFYVSAPAAFLTLFGAGAVAQLASYDFQLNNLFKRNESVFPNVQLSEVATKGLALYEKALKLPAHFMILALCSGIILGLFRIENPSYALVFFPVLSGLGLWVFVHNSESKWYRNITIGILVVGLLSSLYMAFVDTPAKVGYPLASVKSGATNALEEAKNSFFYEKTFEIEADSLEPHILCGVQSGKREFTVPRTIEVFIGNEKTDITSALRVNNTLPGESFTVKESGCVEVTFAVNEGFKKNSFDQQIIAIKFE